jgi:hypothetical protein
MKIIIAAATAMVNEIAACLLGGYCSTEWHLLFNQAEVQYYRCYRLAARGHSAYSSKHKVSYTPDDDVKDEHNEERNVTREG